MSSMCMSQNSPAMLTHFDSWDYHESASFDKCRYFWSAFPSCLKFNVLSISSRKTIIWPLFSSEYKLTA